MTDDELRAIAEAATQSTWHLMTGAIGVNPWISVDAWTRPDGSYSRGGCILNMVAHDEREQDARFIATFDPPTVLRLLAEARGWQPIETFAEPTSLSRGNGVLIADALGEVGEAYFRNFGDDDDGWWWINTSWGDYPDPDRPALPLQGWQPLPEPPARTALANPTEEAQP